MTTGHWTSSEVNPMPSRTEMFFPESNIWREETIQANTHTYSLDQSETGVEMFQTVFDKQEWMDISADLGLSFMGRDVY